ncbi:MAG: hypothetical protein DMD33_10130 [Gemmatimonadetes bacterium]|nr:MAG: hypothetical protein DMD33_10130 [Gemmatimonadota bacterium]PYO74934.1 MAG: hypothetical protein DMD67_12750 [Gemmatimonadota bacterium]TLY50636.1 MAG: YbdD/YjiX family protein [Gemmatimonadota bacterium]
MPQGTERGTGRQEAAEGGKGWRRALRRMFGMPDYDAYLEHCRTAGHPPRLSEREYVAEFFETKGKGVRCC